MGAYRFRAEIADLDPKAYEGTSRGTKVKTPRGGVFIRGVTKIGSGRTELRSYAPRPYFRKGKESDKARKYNKKGRKP